jgi:hypothetical protein
LFVPDRVTTSLARMVAAPVLMYAVCTASFETVAGSASLGLNLMVKSCAPVLSIAIGRSGGWSPTLPGTVAPSPAASDAVTGGPSLGAVAASGTPPEPPEADVPPLRRSSRPNPVERRHRRRRQGRHLRGES